MNEQSTKLVTPLGDFNAQSFPIDPNKCYNATEEELEKLGRHELKWSLEEYQEEEPVYEEQETTQEVEVDDLENPIYEEVEGEQTVVGYEKKTVEMPMTSLVQTGTKLVTKYHVSLVENDNTAELAHNNAVKRIAELKKYLSDTDYVVVKIAEGVATTEEYSEVLARRQSAREEINSLENSL